MNATMWRGLIDFAENIQILLRAGWTFTREYGEERLGIRDRMIFTKGDRTEVIFDEDDLQRLIRELTA